MNTIDPKSIKSQLNKCYNQYDPDWLYRAGEKLKNGFKYHIEQTAGIRIDIQPNTTTGGYKVESIEIINEPLFTLWMLKWS
jgi:hypothetical protein